MIEGLITLSAIFLGALLIISGALMVVFGQSVSCFVAIEKNTRTTHELIKSQITESHDTGDTNTFEGNNQNVDDDISNDNLFK